MRLDYMSKNLNSEKMFNLTFFESFFFNYEMHKYKSALKHGRAFNVLNVLCKA